MKFIRMLLMTCLLSVPTASFAKRAAPQKVEPVSNATVRVEAPVDDGRKARINVYDLRDNRLLWSLVVFENKIDPDLEEDVQWRFIKSLELTGDTLEVTAEGGARYRVFLKTRKAEPIPRKE